MCVSVFVSLAFSVISSQDLTPDQVFCKCAMVNCSFCINRFLDLFHIFINYVYYNRILFDLVVYMSFFLCVYGHTYTHRGKDTDTHAHIYNVK